VTAQVENLKVEEEVDVIVPGPAQDAAKKWNEKKLKKVTKEGGKRGVEIEGAADMGGLQFFCTQMQEPGADLPYLVESMKAMNAKSNPSDEERKGGAGKIGKIILSSTETKMALVCYVPKQHSEKCNAKKWLESVLEKAVDSKAGREAAVVMADCESCDNANWCTAVIQNSQENNVFVLKFRDAIISHAYTYLKPLGLFPEDDEDDEDDYVFGDDDFPTVDDEETATPAAAAPVETYDLLCPIAERLQTAKMEKKLKKVVKEGGKRGVEIEGAADMGGLQFFCTAIESPGQDLDMLVESMRAMNAKSDPSAEERKGGSGRIGKTILSMTDDKICLVCYVPEEKKAECNATEWLTNTVTMILKSGKCGDDVADVAKGMVESHPGNEGTFAKAAIAKDGEKGLYPIKMKDEAINQGYAYLKARKLFPDGNDDDDDECCWGDDDFPDDE
jgi:alanyl-tRNA synthetase